MNIIPVRSLNMKGRRAFYDLICEKSAARNAAVTRDEVEMIILDADNSDEVPGAGCIDTHFEARDTHHLLDHIYPAVKPLVDREGPGILENPGVNMYLNLAFFVQQTTKASGIIKIREPNAYCLELAQIDPSQRTRNYRNAVFANLLFYALHHDDPTLCRTFLTTPVGELSHPVERLCQKVAFMGSRGAWKLVEAAFMDQANPGKYHRPKAGVTVPVSATDALEDYFVYLFSEVDQNFDVQSMTAAQLHVLLPPQDDYRYWNERSAAALGLLPAETAAIRKPGKTKVPPFRKAANIGAIVGTRVPDHAGYGMVAAE